MPSVRCARHKNKPAPKVSAYNSASSGLKVINMRSKVQYLWPSSAASVASDAAVSRLEVAIQSELGVY